jgi:hypothetical protein
MILPFATLFLVLDDDGELSSLDCQLASDDRSELTSSSSSSLLALLNSLLFVVLSSSISLLISGI